ncbi:MAG: DUF2892 domain-containing protein [Bacteroidetes bacterium]|nr:DUF2892 domain-containing protein [Bacteroidota bacterium]
MNYNLSWYEVAARYVIGILVLIPSAMFLFKPTLFLGAAIMISALLGMCPLKALIMPKKKEENAHSSQKFNQLSTDKNMAA